MKTNEMRFSIRTSIAQVKKPKQFFQLFFLFSSSFRFTNTLPSSMKHYFQSGCSKEIILFYRLSRRISLSITLTCFYTINKITSCQEKTRLNQQGFLHFVFIYIISYLTESLSKHYFHWVSISQNI